MEKVADVLGLKFPQFNTISPGHLVSDALYQMCCENVDYLIVLEDDKFTGILTDHDITNKVLFANKPLNEIKVKDFMNRSLPVATPHDSIEFCMQLLDRYNSGYLAVYDQFTFKGVVSANDLMKHALSKRNSVFNQTIEVSEYKWSY